MATRRSRLQFKPNIGPKSGPKQATQGTKSSSGDTALKTGPKTLTVNTRRISTDSTRQNAHKDDPKSPLREILHSPVKCNQFEKARSPRKELVSNNVPKKRPKINPKDIGNEDNVIGSVTQEQPSDVEEYSEEKVDSNDFKKTGNDEEEEELGVPVGNLMTVEKSFFTERHTVTEADSFLHNIPEDKCESQSLDHIPVKELKNVEESVEVETEPPLEEVAQENVPQPTKKSQQKHKRHLAVHVSEDGTVDRTKMKMSDLIFYNPNRNFMKTKASTKKVDAAKEPVMERNILLEPTVEETRVDDVDGDETSQDALPVPQVKIGPDGSLIINEESLVIENKNNGVADETDVVDETDSSTTYASFRAPRKRMLWDDYETDKFYKALSCIGTDFSLMLKIFPFKTRLDLKKKFMKEDRENRGRVEKALRQREIFDVTVFENMDKQIEMAKKKEVKVSKRQPSKNDSSEKKSKASQTQKKKRKRNPNYYGDDENEDDGSLAKKITKEQVNHQRNDPETKVDLHKGTVTKNNMELVTPNNDNLNITGSNIVNTLNMPTNDPNQAPLILVYSNPEEGSTETVIHVFRLQPEMTRADGSVVINNSDLVSPIATLSKVQNNEEETSQEVVTVQGSGATEVPNNLVSIAMETEIQNSSVGEVIETRIDSAETQNVTESVSIETSGTENSSAENVSCEPESSQTIENQKSQQNVIVESVENSAVLADEVILETSDSFPSVETANFWTSVTPSSTPQTFIDINLIKTDSGS